MFLRFKKELGQKGQSATEYMLVIAVIVIGLVAAGSRLIPLFEEGLKTLGTNVQQYLGTGQDMTKAGDG